eukprot:6186138-Pleurochrysis_carterae.AAC.1
MYQKFTTTLLLRAATVALRYRTPGGAEQSVQLSPSIEGCPTQKFGRNTVCWRPLSATDVVYNYVDGRTGLPVRRSQSYKSSPMEQMMKRIVAREEASHDVDSAFARPETLRLWQELRRCKLKCELADAVS